MLLSDLLLGLFGGGAIVQLLQTLINRRATRRQLNANALGTEIEALEHTIAVLRTTLDAEMERHERERRALLERIEQLNAAVSSLSERVYPRRGTTRQRRPVPSDTTLRPADDSPFRLRPPP